MKTVATQMLLLVVLSTMTPSTHATEENFSYDPSSEFGPQHWAELDIENNQCGGNAQSGINIESSSCNEYNATYIFNVSNP